MHPADAATLNSDAVDGDSWTADCQDLVEAGAADHGLVCSGPTMARSLRW
jgi:hypothetical protein